MRVAREKMTTQIAPVMASISASAEPQGHWNVSISASTTVTAIVFTRRPPISEGVT